MPPVGYQADMTFAFDECPLLGAKRTLSPTLPSTSTSAVTPILPADHSSVVESVRTSLENCKNFASGGGARRPRQILSPTPAFGRLKRIPAAARPATALGLVFGIVGRHHSTSQLESTRAQLRARRPYQWCGR